MNRRWIPTAARTPPFNHTESGIGPKEAERLKAGEAWQDGGYVSTDELGKPYSPDYVSKSFEALVEASGLPRARLQDHTAFSLMLAAGVQPKVVQELAGHLKISASLSASTATPRRAWGTTRARPSQQACWAMAHVSMASSNRGRERQRHRAL